MINIEILLSKSSKDDNVNVVSLGKNIPIFIFIYSFTSHIIGRDLKLRKLAKFKISKKGLLSFSWIAT